MSDSDKVAYLEIPANADVEFIEAEDGSKRIEIAYDEFEMFYHMVDGMWKDRPDDLREDSEVTA